MKKLGYFFVFLFFLGVTGTDSWAAGAYVTDSFEVTLRSGPSPQNRATSKVSSGQSLKVLETQGDWSRVRLSSRDSEDAEGWILSRYVITRVPWEPQAKTALEQNTALKEKLARAEQDRKDLKERETDLSGKLQSATAALEKLKREYDSLNKGAAEYITLKKDFDAASSALKTNRSTLEALSIENLELKSAQREKWVLTGAGILLFGLILGLIMGRVKRKKASLYS